jgi:UDP-N-acetylmuramoylalanine--D-glutamate ligase
MNAFAGERALVVGLGASGMAAARVLIEEGAAVRVSECRPLVELEDVASFESLGVDVRAGGHHEDHLDDVSLVVVSPGVPQDADVIEWAAARRIPVWSELELGVRLCRAPYVAVTGTNGKTTTTEMIAAIMRAAGLSAVACGNVGYPFSLAAREPYDALAVEASSFQLRFHESFHPRVSVLLNIAADHLDWHGSLDAYAAAKARVFALQDEAIDTHIGNADDEESARISRSAPCRVQWFRLGEPKTGEVGYRDGKVVLDGEPDIVLGRPASDNEAFRADAAAAAAACIAFGIEAEPIAKTIEAFEPLAHRGEIVAVAGSVTFVNDSKATNPHAVLAGLAGRQDVVLIAGGRTKGVDLSPLLEAAPRLRGVVAIGEAAGDLVALFADVVPVRTATSIEDAVDHAFAMAGENGSVVLAPAGASQDMFRDYRERGERFAEAAARLAEREAANG